MSCYLKLPCLVGLPEPNATDFNEQLQVEHSCLVATLHPIMYDGVLGGFGPLYVDKTAV
jgi:hypothetical protein